VQDRLVELVVTPRVTVPENPLSAATVIVDVPGVPVVTVTLIGLAVTVKSCAWKITSAE
jgi:hypothetical protein